MKYSEKEVEAIRSKIADDISDNIFENRILFSKTSDYKYIREIVRTNPDCRNIVNQIENSYRKITIFGAGSIGKRFGKTFRPYVEQYLDNQKKGQCLDAPIKSLNDYLKEGNQGIIMVCSKYENKEIINQLKNYGVDDDSIVNVCEIYLSLNHKQYFDLIEMDNYRKDNEVFVDGGGFDGTTTLDFFRWFNASDNVNTCCKHRQAYSYIWEPEKTNIEKIHNNLSDISDYEIVEKGLWNDKTVLKFSGNGSSANISDEGDIQVEVDMIDNVCTRKPTFIKMDIEGAEYNALLGARKVIANEKPKLAISVYHRPEDIIELPKLVLTINPDYKLYFRHYSLWDNETVLYAL